MPIEAMVKISLGDNKNYLKKQGFTMLEILLVVAMIAILAGIVIIAVNPAKQLASARNAQRRVDVNTIINAVYQYLIDNNGTVPAVITTDSIEICSVLSPPGDCSGYVNMSFLLENQKYLPAMPHDPGGATACAENSSCYSINVSTNGRITVSAPNAELSETISVTR